MADMNGKFFMSDVYGGIWGTTEQTIPEAADKQALVEDQATAAKTGEVEVKAMPILLAVGLIFILALVLGGLK